MSRNTRSSSMLGGGLEYNSMSSSHHLLISSSAHHPIEPNYYYTSSQPIQSPTHMLNSLQPNYGDSINAHHNMHDYNQSIVSQSPTQLYNNQHTNGMSIILCK